MWFGFAGELADIFWKGSDVNLLRLRSKINGKS